MVIHMYGCIHSNRVVSRTWMSTKDMTYLAKLLINDFVFVEIAENYILSLTNVNKVVLFYVTVHINNTF